MGFALFGDQPVYVSPGQVPVAPKNGRTSSLFGLFPGSPSYESPLGIPSTEPAPTPAPCPPSVPSVKWVRFALQVPGALAVEGAVTEDAAKKLGVLIDRAIAHVADLFASLGVPPVAEKEETERPGVRPEFEERMYERE